MDWSTVCREVERLPASADVQLVLLAPSGGEITVRGANAGAELMAEASGHCPNLKWATGDAADGSGAESAAANGATATDLRRLVPQVTVRAQGRELPVRVAGVPEGKFLPGLLRDLADHLRGEPRLSQSTRAQLAQVKAPLTITVFAKPECPFCPVVVHLAQAMALENPLIQAQIVSIDQFPGATKAHRIFAVPRVELQGKKSLTIPGTATEGLFLRYVLRAAGVIEG